MTTVKAIETRYKGHRFRSRLEARWAVALDFMKIKWQYEQEGYNLGDLGCYLPDFWLPDLNTFMEIKPGPPSPEEKDKLHKLIQHKQAFGVFGFNLNELHPVLNWFPSRSLQDDDDLGSYDYFADLGPNPWPSGLPRPTGAHVLRYVPIDKDNNEDMVCPICGSNYVHVADPVKLTQDYPHIVGSRGPVHAIKARSELCCHTWDLVVAFHKGNTRVAITFEDDGQVTPFEHLTTETPWGKPNELFMQALKAGLSARFEHGEAPQ
jgi:hypothetical protein